MDEKDTLKLFREIVETTKEVTERNPNAFYLIFSSFVAQVQRISNHIRENNLRTCFFYLFALDYPLRESYNYLLIKKTTEKIKDLYKEGRVNEITEKLKEIILSSLKYLKIDMLSDEYGRDVINTKKLSENLSEGLKELDGTTKSAVLLDITNLIREILKDFVEESKKDLIEFYNTLIKASEESWKSVYEVINKYMIERDNIAIIWRRE